MSNRFGVGGDYSDAKMKAAVLVRFGDEGSIQLVTYRPKPVCGPHEVCIRVRACALTPLDIQVRRGDFRGLVQTPSVPGYSISGTIDSVGSLVSDFAVGDEVACVAPLTNPHGGLAEYTVQRATLVVKKQGLLSFEAAAAVLVPGLSAYTILHYQLRPRPGEFLLLLAGAQGCNTVFVSIAAKLGLRIIVAASNTDAMNMYSDHPAVSRVVDVNNECLATAVADETGGLGVQCIVDYMSRADVSKPAPAVLRTLTSATGTRESLHPHPSTNVNDSTSSSSSTPSSTSSSSSLSSSSGEGSSAHFAVVEGKDVLVVDRVDVAQRKDAVRVAEVLGLSGYVAGALASTLTPLPVVPPLPEEGGDEDIATSSSFSASSSSSAVSSSLSQSSNNQQQQQQQQQSREGPGLYTLASEASGNDMDGDVDVDVDGINDPFASLSSPIKNPSRHAMGSGHSATAMYSQTPATASTSSTSTSSSSSSYSSISSSSLSTSATALRELQAPASSFISLEDDPDVDVDGEARELRRELALQARAADDVAREAASEAIAFVPLETLIACLAVGGHLVTVDSVVHVSEAAARQLYLRNASISFHFPYAAVQSPTGLGKHMHILSEILHLTATSAIPAPATTKYGLEKVRHALREVQTAPLGTTIVSPVV